MPSQKMRRKKKKTVGKLEFFPFSSFSQVFVHIIIFQLLYLGGVSLPQSPFIILLGVLGEIQLISSLLIVSISNFAADDEDERGVHGTP
jgi:hypothetical protein